MISWEKKPGALVTRVEYEAEICKRLPNAKAVEFRESGITGRCCHTNVDRYVNEHAEERFKADDEALRPAPG